MIMACVARMFESKYFTEEKLIEWENKPDADKTWALVKTYFTTLYNDRRQFSKAMAGQSVFHQREEANHINNDAHTLSGTTIGSTITTSAHDETAQMIVALEERHLEQMNMVKESSEKAMNMATEAMKQMATQMAAMHEANARYASQASVASAPPPAYAPAYIQAPPGFTGPPPSTAYALQDSGQCTKTKTVGGALMWETKRECPNCKKVVFHFGQDCHTLTANGDKKKKFDEEIKKYSKKK